MCRVYEGPLLQWTIQDTICVVKTSQKPVWPTRAPLWNQETQTTLSMLTVVHANVTQGSRMKRQSIPPARRVILATTKQHTLPICVRSVRLARTQQAQVCGANVHASNE